MPRRDGTGPFVADSMIRQNLWDRQNYFCNSGYGFGCRHGLRRVFRKCFVVNQINSKLQTELLEEQKNILKVKLIILMMNWKKLYEEN